MHYGRGRETALIKLGLSFGTPGKALLAHGAAGAALGATAGYAGADEGNGVRNALVGGALGAGAGAGLKQLLNKRHMSQIDPLISHADTLAKQQKDLARGFASSADQNAGFSPWHPNTAKAEFYQRSQQSARQQAQKHWEQSGALEALKQHKLQGIL